MDAPEMVANILNRNADLIEKAFNELSDEELRTRPNDQCNPIGWMLWHQFRTEDTIIASISGKSQTWIDGGWHANFGLPADPAQNGLGATMDQVMALTPTVEHLKGYGAAVRQKTLSCLKTLSPADLDVEVSTPVGLLKAGDYLGILVSDQLGHSGQVAYLCGYLKGSPWLWI